MIESMLVMIPVLFVLVFILCLGFFFYQSWNVQITAEEVASRVAEVYPLLESDLKTGVSDYSEVEAVAKYRYLALLSGDKYETENEARGEEYGKQYLSLVSLAYSQGEPKIEVEVVEDGLSSRHIHVSVEGTYRLPFSEGFEVFGLKGSYTFTGDGYAVCTDLSDYLGMVNYLTNLENILNLNGINAYKALSSIISMVKKIAAAVDSMG